MEILTTGVLFSHRPLQITTGAKLENIQVGYTITGKFPNDGNYVLVCHAFTGDQFVSEPNPVNGRPGWWEDYVGPDKAIDTNRFTVICSNVLGSCMGTTGPSSKILGEEVYWGASFPLFQIEDIVQVQKALMDYLQIDSWHSIVGGSMGGMQVLEWLRLYPESSRKFAVIASSYKQNPQNIGFNEIGRQAILGDEDWKDGNYLNEGTFPTKGLKIARMIGHMTYLSTELIYEKFGRRLQQRDALGFGIGAEFQLESYLNYQGAQFTGRFDPASYVFLGKAVDYFDQSADFAGDIVEAYQNLPKISKKVIDLVSFSSDWLYPPKEMEELCFALLRAGAFAKHTTFDTDSGHDSFLLPNTEFSTHLSRFLS